MIISNGLHFEYTQSNDDPNSKHPPALSDININITKGEFVAILGHNGSGKSTLAKHLNALLTPTAGTLWIKGMDTRQPENTWSVRKSAGMVFQNPDNQIIATVVEEDVAFGPENLGIPPAEIRRRVDETLKTVGMDEYAESAPHHLSGGQKQRVAVAGILAMQPDCIILDEPTAMLDPVGRREVIETVCRLNREAGITVILITHFMEEAVKAGRVMVMHNGAVVMDDTPRHVFRQVDAMRELGLDVPQASMLAYLLRKQGVPVGNDILTNEEFLADACIQGLLV